MDEAEKTGTTKEEDHMDQEETKRLAKIIVSHSMHYFETGRLHPFTYYCWAIGGISLVLFLLGVGVQ